MDAGDCGERHFFSQCEHGHKMVFVKYLVIKYLHIPSNMEAEVVWLNLSTLYEKGSVYDLRDA